MAVSARFHLMRSTAGLFVIAALAVASSLMACSSSDDAAAPAPAPEVDGGVTPTDDGGGPGPILPNPTTITVTTHVAGSSETTGGNTNATWAAFRKDDGSWSPLSPSATAGTYTFETHATRWAAAFVCADNRSSLVAIHEEVATVTSATIELESWCGPAPADVFTITGTLTNVSAATSWLDFGYPLESRGVVLPVAGTSATYEEVNVVSGTWDLAFGLRDDSTQGLTKIALLRNHALTADAKLDVDLSSASAFAPGTKKLLIHGIDAMENINAPIRFATNGGVQGLDVGPQNVGAGPDADVLYSTIPASAQVATDRYRLAIAAEADDHTREVTGSIHDAVDLEVTLPPILDGVTATVTSPTPYVRVTTVVPMRPNAAYVESSVLAAVTNKSHRVWRMSTSANVIGASPSATFAMPDLSAVAGFDAAWTLPTDIERKVTGTIREVAVVVGDGTMTRAVSRTVTIQP